MAFESGSLMIGDDFFASMRMSTMRMNGIF